MNKQLKKAALKSCLIVFLAILIVSTFFFVRADEVQPTSMVTQPVSPDQSLITPEQYYYPSLNNPSNFMKWNADYCNQTPNMDFIVEVLPNACEPNPVTSDLLEEQNVPVLCKLTGIKINPLIDVPNIKSVVPIFRNQSSEIAYINFYPAKSALGSYQFNNPSAIITEGNPTLNNLGYVVVSLKQQPIESKMPSNVSVNVLLNITYDVAKTYGLNTQQFVLPLMTRQEWQDSYKKYSFWNGKGYVRLQEIKEQSAKISVYYNALGNPINPSKEIREGDNIQVNLPGFYCQEGVNVSLDKIEIPTTKARMMVNGDELLLEKGDDIADSNCQVSDIQPDQYGYGGSVSISCNGAVGQSAYVLDLAPRHATVNITDQEGTREEDITVGKEIIMNASYDDKYREEYYYVGHIGKLATAGSKPVDVVVIFAGKGRVKLSDPDKKTLIQAFQEYISNVHSPELGSGLDLRNELNSRPRVNNKLEYVKVIEKDTGPKFGGKSGSSGSIYVESVEGPRQVTYSANIEKAYKEATDQYRNIVNQFPNQKDDSGIYYGIKALRQASVLAQYMFKESDELDFLQQIVDKYQDVQDADVQAEVDSARSDILSLSRGSGNKSIVINSEKGTYYTTLISIERPGYNSQEAHIRVNGSDERIYLLNDQIDRLIITGITDNGVTFFDPAYGEDTVAKSSSRYLINGTTKIEVLSTLVRREAKVTVWPLDKERTTSTNFSVVIGIEKRAIQLTPQQIQKRIQDLNKTIDTLNKYVDALEKLTTTWSKACYIGGSILWAKNLIGGLTGESIARRMVMKAWTIKCASEEYRTWLGSNKLITVSQCYKKNQTEINKDVTSITSIINDANSFVKKVKTKPGVVISSGFLGLTKQINDDKFINESKNLFLSDYKSMISSVHVNIEFGRISKDQKNRLLLLDKVKQSSDQICGTGKNISEILKINEASPQYTKELKNCQIPVPVDVNYVMTHLDQVASKGQVSVDDIKDIYSMLAINQKFGISDTLKTHNNLEIFSKFDALDKVAKDENTIAQLKEEFGDNSAYYLADTEKILPVTSMNTLDEVNIEKFSDSDGDSSSQKMISDFKDKPFKFLYLNTGQYFVVLNPVGSGNYNYAKAFKISKDSDGKYQIENNKAGIKGPLSADEMKDFPAIQLQDITKCTNEMSQGDYQIKFWDKGTYQGMVAYMPIQRDEGWYFATKAYTGMEGQLVSYKDTGQLNEYWICNVGPNGKAEFNFYSGPEGDDDCCIEISKTTNMEIPDMYKPLADKAEKCVPAATSSYNKKENPVNTGNCGKPSLGKPPVAIPSTQCEDFMSPDECSLMFNLCDPVICPSSRCDLGGRFPVENVIQSGIIGSLVLCSQNAGEVAVPICISGLYNGLDALNNMVFKQYKSCLEKQVSSGQTTGLCDYWHSVYFCQLLWGNLDPFIKAGIPAVTESITQGGGEYSMFSEAFKSSQDSLSYFTQTYGPNAFTSFKANSVNQSGTTVCDKFISITYPTAAKFFDDLTKADSYYQVYASVDEVPFTSSPESQYRVFYDIYAGKDQPISYYVYLKKKVSQNYAYESDQFQVKDSFGFLTIGQTVSDKKDFTAPSGYNEICVNINGKDNCGFATVSTSFGVQELQNVYLEDQIKKNIKTQKECEAGSVTLVPTASLNIQSQLQEHIQPAIYRQGIIRICSSTDPGATTDYGRYQRIGYCDNQNIGCWLDMQSVNASISDLGIVKDIENYTQNQTLSFLLDHNFVDPVEISESKLLDAESKLEDIRGRVNAIIDEINKKFMEATTSSPSSKSETGVEVPVSVGSVIAPITGLVAQNQAHPVVAFRLTYKNHEDQSAAAEQMVKDLLNGISGSPPASLQNGMWSSKSVTISKPDGWTEITSEEYIQGLQDIGYSNSDYITNTDISNPDIYIAFYKNDDIGLLAISLVQMSVELNSLLGDPDNYNAAIIKQTQDYGGTADIFGHDTEDMVAYRYYYVNSVSNSPSETTPAATTPATLPAGTSTTTQTSSPFISTAALALLKQDIAPDISESQDIIQEIDALVKELKSTSDRCFNIEDKARAQWDIAQLLDLKARLVSTADMLIASYMIQNSEMCLGRGGTWMAVSICPQDYTEVTDAIDNQEHVDEKCCYQKVGKFEFFDKWFTNDPKILDYNTKTKVLRVTGTKINSLGRGKVISAKREFSNIVGAGNINYIVQYAGSSDNLYVKYTVSTSAKIQNGVRGGQDISSDNVIFENPHNSEVVVTVYINKESNKKDPFCFFKNDVIKQVKAANTASNIVNELTKTICPDDPETNPLCVLERQGLENQGKPLGVPSVPVAPTPTPGTGQTIYQTTYKFQTYPEIPASEYDDLNAFKAAIAVIESLGNYQDGATTAYYGRYAVGAEDMAVFDGAQPSKAEFLASPELQEIHFDTLLRYYYNQLKDKGYLDDIGSGSFDFTSSSHSSPGQYVKKSFPITLENMLALRHFGGIGAIAYAKRGIDNSDRHHYYSKYLDELDRLETLYKSGDDHMSNELSSGDPVGYNVIIPSTSSVAVTPTPVTPNTPATSISIDLVSNLNDGNFNEINPPIVNPKDDVEICAVITQGSDSFSNDIVVSKDGTSLNIKKWPDTSPKPIFTWYKIEPIQKPSYPGASGVYSLLAAPDGTKSDIIQYGQVLIDGETDWCINQRALNPNAGTYWYRVQTIIDSQQISSLGNAATSSDLAAYQKKYSKLTDLTKYATKMNTLLEPRATDNYGISTNVMRISRQSDYATTTCASYGYQSTDLRCQFISNLESFKNVPFAFGCGYYSCGDLVPEGTTTIECPTMTHLSEDFIAINCINLMISALRQTTGNVYTFNSVDNFINNEYGQIPAFLPAQQKLSTILNAGFTFGDGQQIEVGDILFVWKASTGYTHTFIIYKDAGTIGKLDENDLVAYASNKCPGSDPSNPSSVIDYSGRLCYAPLARYKNDPDLKFTLVKIKDLGTSN